MEDNIPDVPPRRGRPRINREVSETNVNEQDNYLSASEAIIEKNKLERPSLRGNMREDDPRTAAKKRAAEILGHVQTLDEGTDDFYISPAMVPDGWTYEWKRKTIYGQEDPAYQVSLTRMGWEPVPASRHPEMMPSGGKYMTIERKGMVLMERPQEVTDEVERVNNRRARDQVRVKEDQLSSAQQGQFDRNHPQAKPKIRKGYEPMPIPED